jgi:hypothetical protein
MKKIGLIICSLVITGSFAGPDYFPIKTGNTWTWSYASRSAAVVIDPAVTFDSGTVCWEVLDPHFSGGGNLVSPVKQTKSLFRRTLRWIAEVHDTILASPIISIDTIVFKQGIVTVDTLVHQADSLRNAISFNTATCPVAVHDPAGSLPVELTVKDSVIFIGSGSAVAGILGKKVSSRECSCDRGTLWSFFLLPDLGPREAYISVCPGMVGASYSETRKLISYSFPKTAINEKRQVTRLPEMKITKTGTTLACSFGASVRPYSIALYSVSGRKVARFAAGGSGKYVADAGLVPSGCYVLMARTDGGVYNKKLWMGR